jgi:hypothetical protein
VGSGGHLLGQDRLLQGELVVELPSVPEPVPVSLAYVLQPGPGATEVELTLLAPGSTAIRALEARWDGGRLPLLMDEIRTRYWTGAIRLPAVGQPSFSLQIDYRVDGAWGDDGRIVLPLITPAWVPRDPNPRTFVAGITVPPGLTVTESFPTSVVARPETARGGRYEIALQGVPAMLVLRTVPGEAPFLTLERLLDILVVTLLLVMGTFGLRYLKREGT